VDRFEESFPPLLAFFLRSSGVSIPSWLTEAHGCPWATRAEFFSGNPEPENGGIAGSFSRETIGLQARFAANRLEQALPKMLANCTGRETQVGSAQFCEGSGAFRTETYSLVDYINFKGEGTLETERYKGEGWGLLQVLEDDGRGVPALQEFSLAADKVLTPPRSETRRRSAANNGG